MGRLFTTEPHSDKVIDQLINVARKSGVKYSRLTCEDLYKLVHEIKVRRIASGEWEGTPLE